MKKMFSLVAIVATSLSLTGCIYGDYDGDYRGGEFYDREPAWFDFDREDRERPEPRFRRERRHEERHESRHERPHYEEHQHEPLPTRSPRYKMDRRRPPEHRDGEPTNRRLFPRPDRE